MTEVVDLATMSQKDKIAYICESYKKMSSSERCSTLLDLYILADITADIQINILELIKDNLNIMAEELINSSDNINELASYYNILISLQNLHIIRN